MLLRKAAGGRIAREGRAPAGLYLLRLRVDGVSLHRKVVVTR
jgi:hypothetical protein